MSLVTLIRDYVDVANSSEQLNGSTLSSLVYYTFTFFFTVLKQAIVYCFTFNWLRDLSYFCLTPPLLLSSFPNFGPVNITSVLHYQPLSNLFAFSDSNFSTGIGVVFFAFLNGFFNCLHLSAANLITIQRMLVQGVPAGLCSAFGTAVGQLCFLACVACGFRGLIFPWLAFEPFHFLLGTVILLSIASAAAQDRRTPTIQWSAKSSLLMYTFTSVLLTWCEQTAIFQWMGNISFGTEPTFLETLPSLEKIHSVFENVQQLIQNLGYLVAFFLGTLVGTFFIGYALQRLLEWILRSRGIAIYYGLIKQANLPLATLIFAFGFGSLPYYGFDYLITKEFGFVPKEQFFQQTLFSPTNLVSKTSQAKEPSQGRLEDQLALLFTLKGERTKSFAVDTTPFDDGQYLKASQKRPQAFEDLNYRGEHLWTNRLARISNIREQANQTQSSFLGPIFSWMRSFLWGDGSTATDMSLDKRRDNGKEQKLITQENTPLVNREELLIDTIKQKVEIPTEREQVDSYVKEFDRQFDKGFSNFYNTDPQSLIEVEDQWQEKRIKEKCYTNPIYTFLLNTEIDAFLTRQPKSHLLSPQEEALLLKRRQLLNNYYDTLALTSQVATSEVLGQLVPSVTPLTVPKSYSNAIYNHQFKGTLKIARRLFSIKKTNEISKDETKDISKGKTHTFAYNYQSSPRTSSPASFGNTKLEGDSINASSKDLLSIPKAARRREGWQSSEDNTNEMQRKAGQKHKTIQETTESANNLNGMVSSKLKKLQNQTRTVKFDQPLFSNEKRNVQQIVFHEELPSDPDQNQGTTTSPRSTSHSSYTIKDDNDDKVIRDNSRSEAKMVNKSENIFLLEQAEPLPLYSSWDQGLRKLILTNRYQNRATAGYAISEFSTNSKNSKVATDFTIWPIPDPLSENIGLKHENDTIIAADRSGKINNLSIKDSQAQTRSQPFTDIPSLSSSMGQMIQKVKTGLKGDATKVDKVVNNILQSQTDQNRFLFQSKVEPVTNDMINALLQWQKVTKENKQLSKEDKQAAKEKVSYWPENVSRASWSNELIDNDIELDEPNENLLKKQTFLWEFTLPNHGGFLWPGSIWNK